MADQDLEAQETEAENAQPQDAPSIQEVLDGKTENPQSQENVAPETQKPEKEQEAPKEPFWYRKALKEKEREARDNKRQLDELRQQLERQQQSATDQSRGPVSLEERLETQRLVDRLERSEDRFVDRHGEAKLEEVREWLATRPDMERWAMTQRHPWDAAFQQFNKERIASEIGDDPSAYRERLRAEIMAEMQGEMGEQQIQQTAPSMGRLPQPASGVRSASPQQARQASPNIQDMLKNKF